MVGSIGKILILNVMWRNKEYDFYNFTCSMSLLMAVTLWWSKKDKVKDMSEPKYEIGDIVYLRHLHCSDIPMKIIGRCYDEHWRYKIEGIEDNEYWYYEKDFKNMEG